MKSIIYYLNANGTGLKKRCIETRAVDKWVSETMLSHVGVSLLIKKHEISVQA